MSNNSEAQALTINQIISNMLQQVVSGGGGEDSENHAATNDHMFITLYDLSGQAITTTNDDGIDVESISSDSSADWSEMPSSPPETQATVPASNSSLAALESLFTNIDATTQRQNETDYRRRYAVMLNNIILAYNENMIEYQRNMNALIRVANSVSGVEPSAIQPPSQTPSVAAAAPASQTPTSNEDSWNSRSVQQREIRLNNIVQDLRNRRLTIPERTDIYRQYQGRPNVFSLISREEVARRQPFTQQEINRVTHLVAYNATLGESRCPISLEDFAPGEMVRQINRCGHIFNARVLEEWLMSSALHICCPICRCDMRARALA